MDHLPQTEFETDNDDATPRVGHALAFERVSHWYGEKLAVDDATLTVEAGEIVCLCGPSGCGKSTLLRIAAGLEAMGAGVVRLNGMVIAAEGVSVPPERRGIGLVFQDYALFPHLSVFDNVTFGLTALSSGERSARARVALEQVGMLGLADAYPHQLSGGQQQRAALARALAPNPKVLLLDEPFSGLDARLRERVRDETLRVLRANGVATLLVTHDSEEAMFLADRLALMRDGRVVQMGAPETLYRHPVNAFAARFLGDVNIVHAVTADGWAETPLGRVPARRPDGRAIVDGTAVDVLIRPEAIVIRADQPTLPADVDKVAADVVMAEVLSSRLVGPARLARLGVRAPMASGGPTMFRSRSPGRFPLATGRVVPVQLDITGVFVFPSSRDGMEGDPDHEIT